MTAVACLSTEDVVLEVGPGRGILTEALLQCAKRVIAVEKDELLVMFLQEKFAKEIMLGKLEIVSGDILEFNPASYNLKTLSYKLVANIPYYITGQFLRKFLSGEAQPKTIAVMLQKEVARRIMARDNKESILSISVKVYGTPSYVASVPKKYFSPEPKVDSAIILIDNINRDFFKDIGEEKFFQVLHAGFAHKRKFLIRNLSTVASREALEKNFDSHKIPEKSRAEDITLIEWQFIVASIIQDKSETK